MEAFENRRGDSHRFGKCVQRITDDLPGTYISKPRPITYEELLLTNSDINISKLRHFLNLNHINLNIKKHSGWKN